MGATGLRVLIVDDNRGDAQLEKLALAEQGFECTITTADSGEHALELLRGADAGSIDVVLLDGNLNGISGLETLQAMKADEKLKSIPIVIVSGSSYAKEHARFFECGAEAVIEKCNDFDSMTTELSVLKRYARN
ncbi:Response regulator consisting of a CheY-like receiver domain and a winged-helix DNA-binding domain (fragment) [Candidatus Terasakiella magnetica]